VPTDAGIEPRTVATGALAVRLDLIREKVKQFVLNVVFPVGTNRNGNLVAAEKQGKMSAVRRIFSAVFNERYRGIDDLNTLGTHKSEENFLRICRPTVIGTHKSVE
jgi:hypothetical protein